MLLIYFIHSSLYFLIPFPYFVSPIFPPPSVTTSLFSITVSLFLFCYIQQLTFLNSLCNLCLSCYWFCHFTLGQANLSPLQHCMIFSSEFRKNLYTAFGALLLLISIFSGHSLLSFQLFRLPCSLDFPLQSIRVCYLSFSTLQHAATVVCLQEKAQTWKTHHVTDPFPKFGLLSKIYLPFLLKHREVSFCIFSEILFVIFWRTALLGIYCIILETKIWEQFFKISFFKRIRIFPHKLYRK